MWTRREVKTRGKRAFLDNYWMSVIAALILTFIVGSVGATTGATGSRKVGDEYVEKYSTGVDEDGKKFLTEKDINRMLVDALEAEGIEVTPEVEKEALIALGLIIMAVLTAIAMIAAIATVVKIMILNPLQVGCQGFFLRNLEGPASLGELGVGFRPWLRNVLSIFLEELFLSLWTMLFIIPGVIKSYSYRMVPYILAEDPSCSALDAITRSREMMNGHKWEAFVLDLSFLGWHILGALTFGILEVLFVTPYQLSTNAALYEAIR